jgi:hypothetical protein
MFLNALFISLRNELYKNRKYKLMELHFLHNMDDTEQTLCSRSNSETNALTRTEKSQSSHVMEGEELHTVVGRSDPKTKRGEPMNGGRGDTKKIVFRLQDVFKM